MRDLTAPRARDSPLHTPGKLKAGLVTMPDVEMRRKFLSPSDASRKLAPGNRCAEGDAVKPRSAALLPLNDKLCRGRTGFDVCFEFWQTLGVRSCLLYPLI